MNNHYIIYRSPLNSCSCIIPLAINTHSTQKLSTTHSQLIYIYLHIDSRRRISHSPLDLSVALDELEPFPESSCEREESHRRQQQQQILHYKFAVHYPHALSPAIIRRRGREKNCTREAIRHRLIALNCSGASRCACQGLRGRRFNHINTYVSLT